LEGRVGSATSVRAGLNVKNADGER
jgi:hypothetical protein